MVDARRQLARLDELSEPVQIGVVDDMVGAQGSHQIEFGSTAYAGDFRPEGLGQPDGVAADSAGCADDVHLAGEPDLDSLRRRAAYAGPVGATALVYRIGFHVVGD